jgi:membrane-associated protease RseP (regulator of RpoE activity)
LGVRIDGVLGFPLFRETLLTLDYPHSRVVLQPAGRVAGVPGTVVSFDDARKTPVISVKLGDRSLVALVDSGSDAWFSLNPVGVSPAFAAGPALGATIGTLGGEHTQKVGRLAETLVVGGQSFERPMVELTEELSSIGGGVLRHFSVSFDQLRERVIFFRDVSGPIECPPLRSAGVSFSKTPAYWRVAGVVPRSPAEAEGIRAGDLVIRINGEPVASWDFHRFEALVAEADEMTVTLLNGTTESDRRWRIFELVP